MQNETNPILDRAVSLAIAVVASIPRQMGSTLDIKQIMKDCYEAVENAPTPAVTEPVVEALHPAVPVKKSVTPDFIVCLEDGKKFKSLKRHLMTHFKMTPEDYRKKWSLPDDYPMVAPNYAAVRSSLAKANGLGTKR